MEIFLVYSCIFCVRQKRLQGRILFEGCIGQCCTEVWMQLLVERTPACKAGGEHSEIAPIGSSLLQDESNEIGPLR